MRSELGIARCGLACCLCSENESCAGCNSDGCADREWCENRRCSAEKGLAGCYECPETDCRRGLLLKSKPYGFTQFVRRYGREKLIACLSKNERVGVVYHRSGVVGDYDDFEDAEALIEFILNAGDKSDV